MFHDVPCVIILVEKTLMIEINPMKFLFWKQKIIKSDMCPKAICPILKQVSYID